GLRAIGRLATRRCGSRLQGVRSQRDRRDRSSRRRALSRSEILARTRRAILQRKTPEEHTGAGAVAGDLRFQCVDRLERSLVPQALVERQAYARTLQVAVGVADMRLYRALTGRIHHHPW